MTVALSLRQPWAWMVVHGGKIIENRRWDTPFRGEFLIHAAKGMTRKEYDEAVLFARTADPSLVVPPFEYLLRGGIIGRARLVSVIPPCVSEDFEGGLFAATACTHQWHMPEQYGFMLEQIEATPFQPMRGMLGFFEVRSQPSGTDSGEKR
jgi:hypothetical protein